MWMTPLHLHVNQKSDYDDDDPPDPKSEKKIPVNQLIKKSGLKEIKCESLPSILTILHNKFN